MAPSKQDIPVIFEDEHLLVINKPADLVVNRAESILVDTLQDWFDQRYPQLDVSENCDEARLFKSRSGLVHRLDKDTSGVMLMAKTPHDMKELMRQFKSREVEKNYQALVHGKLSPRSGNIRLPIARSLMNRKQFSVQPFGRASYTEYQVVRYYTDAEAVGLPYEYTLVDLFPKTGRTHQIRVHCTHIGHPLVSDQLYGSKKMLKRDLSWCSRQFLHAKSITFTHPNTRKRVTFQADLSADLIQALATRTICQ